LHGMGEALHEIHRELGGVATRIYAPVGTHEDLLAYLVRRLLENGANTSFVNRLADAEAPIADIIADPVAQIAAAKPHRNPNIPLPRDLLPGRKNSAGFLFSDPRISKPLLGEMQTLAEREPAAVPLIGGQPGTGDAKPVRNPSDRRRIVGSVTEASGVDASRALAIAHKAQRDWDALRGDARAAMLDRAANLFETNHALLMTLAVCEAGKTLPNALAEVREAVDFLRFYACRARELFEMPTRLPGPTGEANELTLHGRGAFVCISPWNFPLSIFTGQV